jgi:hypothetical protein
MQRIQGNILIPHHHYQTAISQPFFGQHTFAAGAGASEALWVLCELKREAKIPNPLHRIPRRGSQSPTIVHVRDKNSPRPVRARTLCLQRRLCLLPFTARVRIAVSPRRHISLLSIVTPAWH